MKKKRLSCAIFIAAVLALIIGMAGIAAVVLWWVPMEAERLYGPGDPDLAFDQRLLLSIQLVNGQNKLFLSADPYGTEQTFNIGLGESTGTIISRLAEEGLIEDADLFRSYLVYTGLDTSLQAGQYRLSPGMAPVEIAQTLQDATPGEITFNVLSGWRMEEIAAALDTSGFTISPESLLAAARTPTLDQIEAFELPPAASLEGFLFPGSYVLSRETSAEELVAALVKGFQENITTDMRAAFLQQNLSLYEAVTLAAIIEREAVIDEEMPQIASVFFNRLSAGMKLDSDPTAQYALGYNQTTGSWWKSPLSLTDLQVNSPYNTYLTTGLPPGPIANPSREALQAVAFPDTTPYFYFRAECNGSGRHIFSVTFDEHLQNACP